MDDLDTTIARLLRISPEQSAVEARRLLERGDAVALAARFEVPRDAAQQIMYPQTLKRRLIRLNRYLDEVGA